MHARQTDSLDGASHWLTSLAGPQRVRVLASLAFNLTIAGRALCHSETPGDCRLEQLRQLNEIQHRVLSYIGHALDANEDVVWVKPVLAFVFEAADAAVRSEAKWAWRQAMHSVIPTRESEAT